MMGAGCHDGEGREFPEYDPDCNEYFDGEDHGNR